MEVLFAFVARELRTGRLSIGFSVRVKDLLLSTDLWAGALIRRVELAGAYATVARKGDPRAGAVLVKVLDRRSGEAWLYASAVRGQGEQVWMQPVASSEEAEVDDFIARQIRFDPDLWIIEIEDPQRRHFLTEPVESR
jgi:hypothetical protein